MSDHKLFQRLLIIGIIANIAVIALIILDRNNINYPSQTWKTYYSSKFGYTINYPSDWTKKELEIKDVEEETRFVRNKDTYFSILYSLQAARIANLLRAKSAELGEALIVQCHTAVLDDLKRKFGSITTDQIPLTKVGGPTAQLESLGTELQFKIRRGLVVRKMSGTVITTWNDNKPISLLMVCPERDLQKIQPLFDEFTSSFKPGKVYR
jgi:hypothetical protein